MALELGGRADQAWDRAEADGAPAVVAGPLLLAARSWVAGALCSAVAVAGAVLVGPRWHRLSRRWFVLVPAGVVVHPPAGHGCRSQPELHR